MARQYDDAEGSEWRESMKRPDTPFPKHWVYYIALKFVVLAAAVLLALYLFGVI